MKVRIIDSTPISGQYPEYSFGERFNSTLWTEFKSDQGDIWYGCFAKSWDKGFSKAIIDEKGERAFIVAGGQGYLIDTSNKKLLLKTEDYPAIESAIKTDKPEYFIAGTFFSAYVIDSKATLKKIEPDFTTDGIYFTGQKGNKAIGNLAAAMNQYENNYDFELDLDTLEFKIHNRPSFWTKLFGK